MLVLDTDVLIDFQRGHAPTVTWFQSLAELPSIPGFVAMELLQDAKERSQLEKAKKLFAPFPLAWPSQEDCHLALADFAAFHLSHQLGLLDSLIASIARGLSATLCTFNVKHYRVVPELMIVQPYAR